MASFNKIIIVGYLGRDPETRYTPTGEAVANFSVATTERRKDQAGEYQDQTTWFRVTVWGKRAEFVGDYLKKGNLVYVEGRLRMQEFTDRDGKPRASLEVTASDVQSMTPKPREDGAGEASAPVARAATAKVASARTPQQSALIPPDDGAGYVDDEIPF